MVWLNSASSIRYPLVFGKEERRVEITGEAYFEVEKGKEPFVVNADNRTEIEVLGTQFNVNTYTNETSLNTTLVEGKVLVKKGDDRHILQPGEQARTGNNIEVVGNVNIEKVISWKNGAFNFDGAGLQEVMRQLERWYDIDIAYEKGVPDIRFVGEIKKDITLNDLLEILEKSGVHFRLEEGRHLIVTP